VNPSRYTFYIEFEDFQVVGASPELLVKVDDGFVVNHPIAGTRPRGKTDVKNYFWQRGNAHRKKTSL
jgi:anthranilate synthase component 1